MKATGSLLLFFTFLSLQLKAQFDDIGAWFGATVEKQLTRNLVGSINEQIRLKQDVSDIDVLLTDGGLEYTFSRKVKAGIHYRFIQSNRENYYSKRHRIYLDASYREKFKLFSLTLRERIQEQYNDYYSSENGKIPTWTLRSKLTAKFDIKKKYVPYISGEIYYLVDNEDETDQRISRYRYETGINYEFNRMHSLNPFVLFQHTPSEVFNELIFGISYTMYL